MLYHRPPIATGRAYGSLVTALLASGLLVLAPALLAQPPRTSQELPKSLPSPEVQRAVLESLRTGPRLDDGADQPNVTAIRLVDGAVACDWRPYAVGQPNAFTFSDSDRWYATATNGSGLNRGDPTTITWGFADDGSFISADYSPAANSDLIAYLDTKFGSGPGGPDLTQRPWYPHFAAVFATWSTLTGITYVYEPNDDGVSLNSFSYPGVQGVRADVRIGGKYIDGDGVPGMGDILAYNYYPDLGDMVLDTGESSFFNNSSGNYLGLRNTLAHEHGHGLGFGHVCPINQTKLMEPYVSFSFDGAQEDDVLAGNRGYGDTLEPPDENDSRGMADPLSFAGDTASVSQVSIDGTSDVDYYSFAATAGAFVSATLTPTGHTYLSGPQNPNTGACSAGTSFNALAQSDLTLQVQSPTGTSLGYANNTGLGGAETLTDVALPNGAGTYYVVVDGTQDKAQMYSLSVTVEQPANLAVTKQALDATSFEGTSLWYEITVTNSGGPGVGVVATDTLPSGVTFVESTGCSESPGGGVPTCTLGSLGAGESKSYHLRVVLDQNLLPGTTMLTNNVSVNWTGGSPVVDDVATAVAAQPSCTSANLTLDSNDDGSSADFLTEGQLSAGSGFTVGASDTVRFYAGTKVVLSANFSVASGGTFSARVDDQLGCAP